MTTNPYELFLNIVRIGIGHDAYSIRKALDWNFVKALADEQGLSAVVLDGLDKCHADTKESVELLPIQLKLEWIGEVLQNYEQRHVQYEKALSLLAGFYNQHGFKMMVLKGYACSLDWPKPAHRPCGDIDVWLFGQWKEADSLLSKEKRIKIDKGHHHHTVFDWNGFMVENHYDFVNVHSRKSSKKLETIFKGLGQDDTHFVEVNGEKMYLPSPNLHALFLIRHMVSHFAAAEITLRQVLDWAFFVEKHTKEIDWKWLEGVLEKYHMKDFYNCINAICVGDLGFNVKIYPQVQFDPIVKEKVLRDILMPAFTADEPEGFVRRIVYKYRRWQGNAWKQELCYGESRSTLFWGGVWKHLLKPRSI